MGDVLRGEWESVQLVGAGTAHTTGLLYTLVQEVLSELMLLDDIMSPDDVMVTADVVMSDADE